jgi:hypothetical protein
MNIKTLTLSIITLAAAGSAVSQPVLAQGARFDFAPHQWAVEKPGQPTSRYTAPVGNVRSGAVPHGSSFLGLDPGVLSKPAPVVAPIAQTIVAPRTTFTSVVPRMIPQVPAAFKSAFGQPISPTTPVIAQAATPQPPLTVRPISSSKSVGARLLKPSVANKSVSGQLLNHKRTIARSAGPALAMPAKHIDSYGNNVGYIAGPFIPTMTGGGMSSSATVSGRLMKH